MTVVRRDSGVCGDDGFYLGLSLYLVIIEHMKAQSHTVVHGDPEYRPMKRLLAVLMLFGIQAAITDEFGLNHVAERSP